MTINLKLAHFGADVVVAHRHGIVSFDEAAIYDANIYDSSDPTKPNKNGSRVKSLFAHNNRFSSMESYDIASKTNTDKQELAIPIDADNAASTSNTLNMLQERKANLLLTNRNRRTPAQNAELNSLTHQINAINSSLHDTSPSDNTADTSVTDAYNPDFSINTVSYLYSNTSSNHGSGSDGIGAENSIVYPHAPNFDVGSRTYKAPHHGAGGFGNAATESTIGTAQFPSLTLASKYS
jgi:hypothetical protein